jgi:hypothetical protein
MIRTQLFPPELITEIPIPKITFANWMQARSPGCDESHLDNLIIYLRLRWELGSYFVTGYDPNNGESAGLLGRGPNGLPETPFWPSWNALDGYIKNGYEFERDELWKPITVGECRQL